MVSQIVCTTYEEKAVCAAVENLLKPLGGMEAFVKPGQRVFIKPNMLGAGHPDDAKTTHPAVVYALAKMAVQAGGDVLVGDCPGGDISEGSARRALEMCGFEDAARRAGARTVVCHRHRTVRLPRTGFAMETSVEMLDCDVFINVAKAKTHTYAAYTGAVKNLYGVIPGTFKAAYHATHPIALDFINFVLDIAQQMRPALNVIDGIVGMEGPGPSAGLPRELGMLVASTNPHEADWVMIAHMGWQPMQVPSIALATQRGLLNADAIELVGEGIAALERPFERPCRKDGMGNFIRLVLPKGVQRRIRLRPVVGKNCVGCGVCARSCPVEAIAVQGGRARIDPEKCICCFCCQELCPKKEIKARSRFG
ncbi:MAG: DUF362 domain-containing protein [Eubacteriales bacterium]|nr:DUF362 domain-containing protein [Eubacteriales bacterium]